MDSNSPLWHLNRLHPGIFTVPQHFTRRNGTGALSAKQCAFRWCVTRLGLEIDRQGWRAKFGDTFRDSRVHGAFGTKKRGSYAAARSVHKLSLAVDLLLFRPDAAGRFKYQTKTPQYAELGAFWMALAEQTGWPLRWGGDWSDGNHFSWSHWGAA